MTIFELNRYLSQNETLPIPLFIDVLNDKNLKHCILCKEEIDLNHYIGEPDFEENAVSAFPENGILSYDLNVISNYINQEHDEEDRHRYLLSVEKITLSMTAGINLYDLVGNSPYSYQDIHWIVLMCLKDTNTFHYLSEENKYIDSFDGAGKEQYAANYFILASFLTEDLNIQDSDFHECVLTVYNERNFNFNNNSVLMPYKDKVSEFLSQHIDQHHYAEKIKSILSVLKH